MDTLTFDTMTDKELLHAFVPERSAVELLKEYQNVYNVVMESSASTVDAIPGMGNVKTKKLMLIRELVNRVNDATSKNVKVINGPTDAINYFSFLKSKPKEELWVLLLNTKNHVISSQMVSIGTINGTTSEPREIFQPAIHRLAASIIVAHCHPSGDCAPSPEDERATMRLVQSGRLLGVPMIDHIIIGKYGSCSLKEVRPDLFIGGM